MKKNHVFLSFCIAIGLSASATIITEEDSIAGTVGKQKPPVLLTGTIGKQKPPMLSAGTVGKQKNPLV